MKTFFVHIVDEHGISQPRGITDISPEEWNSLRIGNDRANELIEEDGDHIHPPNKSFIYHLPPDGVNIIVDGTEIPVEMIRGFLQVVEIGARKYATMNFMEQGMSMDYIGNAKSIKNHILEHVAGRVKDVDSGLHPLQHAAVRALMQYARIKRGLPEGIPKPKGT